MLRAVVVRGALFLGLATLAWAAVLAIELLVRAPAIALAEVLLYLPSVALRWSALGCAVVAAVHGARALLHARLGPRTDAIGVGVLIAIAAWPAYRLAESLAQGEGIAEHPQIAAIRVGIGVALVLGWLGAWMFSFVVARSAGAPWWQRALAAAFALGAVAGTMWLSGGVLRPYALLTRQLVFPCWLLVTAFALRPPARFPRAALALACAVLCVATISLAVHAWDPERARYARAEAQSSDGLLAIAETFGSSRDAKLEPLVFPRAKPASCPKAVAMPSLPLSAAQRTNVILLSIDTMRRDAIGKRFGERKVAPNIEAFASHSVFFERAVAPAAGTLYSVASLLTGQSVPQLLYQAKAPRGVFHHARKRLPEQRMVLPAWPTFKGFGYERLITQKTPITWVARTRDPVAPFLDALREARASKRHGMFWLHLVQPHLPYRTQRGFDFGDSPQARYYSEVASDDARIGRVLDHLKANGYFEDSLIIVFSDHGESLGEGGYFGHGVSMARRFSDVPLYVSYPGVNARVSRAAVSLTSIAPTVLHFVDEKIPADMSACSLLLAEDALERCPLPVSTSLGLGADALEHATRKRVRKLADLDARRERIRKLKRYRVEVGFTSSEHRYLIDLETGAERLFDRALDPDERRNLIREQPTNAARFRETARAWSEREAARLRCSVDD